MTFEATLSEERKAFIKTLADAQMIRFEPKWEGDKFADKLLDAFWQVWQLARKVGIAEEVKG